MGAGIGFIPNAIRTIHIDFSADYDYTREHLLEEKRQEYLETLSEFDTITSKKAYVRLHPLSVTDEEVWQEVSFLSQMYFNDVRSNIACIDVCGLENKLSENVLRSEWSAEFNGYGRLISENDDVYLVSIQSTDDDVAFGVVPKRDERSFFEEFWEDNYDKQAWHDARGGYDAYCTKKAEQLYKKYMQRVEDQEEKIIDAINEMYSYTVRTSAWTMSGLIIHPSHQSSAA